MRTRVGRLGRLGRLGKLGRLGGSALLGLGLVLGAGGLAHAKQQDPLTLKDLRITDQGTSARLVLEIDRSAPYRLFTLRDPERLIFDLPKAEASRLRDLAIKKRGLVKLFRYGLFRPEVMRVVFEFSRPISVSAHGALPTGHGLRIFVDVQAVRDSRLRAPNLHYLAKGWSAYAQRAKPPPSLKVETRKQFKGKRKWRILIDPGHGGTDPGTIAHRLREKDVVLAFAHEIARKLRASKRYQVLLTRNKDFFIPLRKRYEIAHRMQADLFLSVHADHFKDKRIRGATIYTLSEVASDRESAGLAQRENRSDILVGQDLSEFTPDVSTILIDLARKSTNRQSWRAAQVFVSRLEPHVPSLKRMHRYAGFTVLKSPNVPSLLLELGYLSNPQDAKNLSSPRFRRKMAGLVLRSLDAYFKGYNPAST